MRKNILILGHNDATQFIDIFNQYTLLFDKQKYKVTVAYLTGNPSEETNKRTLAEEVLFLNIPKKSIRGLKIAAIITLLKLCRKERYEIVICHRYKPTYIMMWVAQFCKIPALFFVMHELKTMTSRARQLVIALLARKNMIFAGVSNAVRDDMQKSLWCIPKDRVITLYNMIDIDHTEPALLSREAARNALNINADEVVFGNIARLAPNKDQASLINAFAAIKKDCPKEKLIILGDGELESALKEQIAALKLQQDIILTGFIPNAFRYMKAFDCFVLSSIQEAFGRVLIEAMIAKLPIIATRVNGIPEVVGDVGILIPAKDVNSFAAAMKENYFLDNAQREKIGENAYARVTNYFSIPAFQQQFWNVELLKRLKD